MNYIFRNMWKTLFSFNLSKNSDPNFKLLQILQINNNLIVDIRETEKGRKLKTGVSLLLPEINWFKKNLIGENKVYILEHSSRIIKMDKKSENLIITVSNSNKVKNIVIKNEEKQKMINNWDMIEKNINQISNELNISTEFSNSSFVKEYIKE